MKKYLPIPNTAQNASTPAPRFIRQYKRNEKVLGGSSNINDRNTLINLSHIPTLDSNEPPLLEQGHTLAANTLTHTKTLIKEGFSPLQKITNNWRGSENLNLKNSMLSFLVPAAAIYGALQIFKAIQGTYTHAKISTGAAITSGFAALSLSKIFSKIMKNGGFQNLQNKDLSQIKTHGILLAILAIYQQITTGRGPVQQFLSKDYKDGLQELASPLQVFNPLKVAGALLKSDVSNK